MANLALTPQATLLADGTTITDAVTALKALLTTYEAFKLTNFNVCNPEDRVLEIQKELQSADIADIAALESEAAGLLAGGPMSKANARGQVLATFADSKTAIIALCNTIVTKLTAYQTTARAAEDTFFGTYAQPTSRTNVSKRYDVALTQVQTILNGWQSPSIVPGVYGILPDGHAINIFYWLGVAQIA